VREELFLMVLFHDVGKATDQFQANIKIGKSSREYPHPFWAMPIVSQFLDSQDMYGPYAKLAILSHHTQLYNMIYYDYVRKKINYASNLIEYFEDIITYSYNQLGFNTDFSLRDISFEIPSLGRRPRKDYEKYIKPMISYDDHSIRDKAIFSYYLSILQLCDDFSSAEFGQFAEHRVGESEMYDSVLKNPSKYVINLPYSKEEIKAKILGQNVPYRFQKELSENKKKFSFLFAPCGRGKTEASLMWAAEIMAKYNNDRIIFALPTQVTCNSMYDRFVSKRGYNFSDEYVGLFHGKSFLKLQDYFKGKEEDIYSEVKLNIRDESFKGNVFHKPISITTIDHIAYSLIHGFSQSDFASGNLQNSIIIIDEIHYYEKQTLSHLMVMLMYLRNMNIPHLLMTGTAPRFLLDKLSDYELIEDSEGLTYQPFEIEPFSVAGILKNEEVFESIYQDYLENKKIFCILNQVAWSQSFYTDLKEYLVERGLTPNIYLYHSRFTYEHRIRKEKELITAYRAKEPCIIIATQIIEISLNISSSIMYSQIAPPDAIGQRGGRLNRTGKHYIGEFHYKLKLFHIDNYKPYDEDLIARSIKHLPVGPCSYMDIKEYCDNVYDDIDLNTFTGYKEYFDKNILFGDKPSDVTYSNDEGKGFKFRESNYQTIDVIPQDCKNRILMSENPIRFNVRIPYYFLRKFPKCFEAEEIRNRNRVFCSFVYGYEVGLEIPDYKTTDDCMF
jgi:CRISPR-associated endonuclease/helicase Cas3